MFICVVGQSYRTGTTLVQRLLNCTEECMIYGEDNSILSDIGYQLKAIDGCRSRRDEQARLFQISKNGWYPNLHEHPQIQIHNLQNRLKQYVNIQYNHSGFKTIGLTSNACTTIMTFGLKTIYCTRNKEDALASHCEMYEGMHPPDMAENVWNSSLPAENVEDYPNIFHFDYDKLDKQLCVDMLEWLKLPTNHVDDVLNVKLREMDNFVNPTKEEIEV